MVEETCEGMKPLIIQGRDGGVIGLERMNSKAYRKSLENGRLWLVHGVTGRVLPFREDSSADCLKKLEELPFAYAAMVDEAGGVAKFVSARESAVEETSPPRKEGEVLAHLAKIIASRHRKMPEGSYTTHLFRAGPDKIRKKLGEEAVELILAGDREEVISEAADLFYHSLVLLEALDIPLSDIFDELRRRP